MLSSMNEAVMICNEAVRPQGSWRINDITLWLVCECNRQNLTNKSDYDLAITFIAVSQSEHMCSSEAVCC